MTKPAWHVAICNPAGRAVGVGVAVPPRHVLTCAHVVERALGVAARLDEVDARAVQARLSGQTKTVSAHIVPEAWRRGVTQGRDVAVLALPEACKPAGFARRVTAPTDPGSVYRLFGYPEDAQNGAWIEAQTAGCDEAGLIQLQRHGPARFIEPGCSGAGAFMTGDGPSDEIAGLCLQFLPGVSVGHLIGAADLERAWPTLASPYPGLRAFDETNARWFFGRSALVDTLCKKLDETGVLLVVGPSGSGKSSVVRAGLLPKLRREGWRIVTVLPGKKPCAALAEAVVKALDPAAGPSDRARNTRELASLIRTDPGEALGHIRLMQDGNRLLLVIDQFEELFTIAPWNERDAFGALLAALLNAPHPSLRLVFTLRSDYEPRLDDLPEPCPNALANAARWHVAPMTRAEIREAVEGAAERLGVAFAESWSEDLKAAASGPGRLPSAQYALQQAWTTLDPGAARLPRPELFVPADAERPDGDPLARMLAAHADAAVADCADSEAAWRLLVDHLVVVSAAGREHDAKRKALRANLDAAAQAAADALAREGVWLLTADRGPDGATVEIAHEALIRSWPRLQERLASVRGLRVWEARCREQMARDGDPPRRVWTPSEAEEADLMLALPNCDAEVAAYVRRVTIYTEAAEIWARLADGTTTEKAIHEVAVAAPELRAALLDQLLDPRPVGCSPEAVLNRLAPHDGLVRALFGVAPGRRAQAIQAMAATDWRRLPPQRRRGWGLLAAALDPHREPRLETGDEIWDGLLAGLAETTDLDQCAALGRALAGLAPWVNDPERRVDALTAWLAETADRDQRDALGQALAALAPRVSDPKRRFDAMTAALAETTAPDQCAAMGQALAALAPQMDDPERGFDALTQALIMSGGHNQCCALGQALAALAQRVNDPGQRFDALTTTLAATTDRDQRHAMEQALAALAPRVNDPEQRFDAMAAALTETSDPFESRAFGQALAALAPRVNDPERSVDALTVALARTTDPNQRNALSHALTALAPQVHNLERSFDVLTAALARTSDPDRCAALGQALAALAPRMNDPEQRFDALNAALAKTINREECRALGQALAALGPLMNEHERRFDVVTAALATTTNRHKLRPLGQTLAALAPRVNEPERRLLALTAVLAETTDPDRHAALGKVLAALARRVNDPTQNFNALTAMLAETTGHNRLAALWQPLAVLAQRANDPERCFDALTAAFAETTNRNAHQALSHALTALALRMSDPERSFDALTAAVAITTDPDKCRALGQALAALAPRVNDPEQRFDALTATLAKTTDPVQFGVLRQTLSALAPRVNGIECRFDAVTSVLSETADRDQCRALGQTLVVLAPRVNDPGRRVDVLTAALSETTDRDQCRALGRALAALAPRVSDPTRGLSTLATAVVKTDDLRSFEFLSTMFASITPRIDGDLKVNAAAAALAPLRDRQIRIDWVSEDEDATDRRWVAAIARLLGLPEDCSVWAVAARLKELRPEADLEATYGQPILPPPDWTRSGSPPPPG